MDFDRPPHAAHNELALARHCRVAGILVRTAAGLRDTGTVTLVAHRRELFVQVLQPLKERLLRIRNWEGGLGHMCVSGRAPKGGTAHVRERDRVDRMAVCVPVTSSSSPESDPESSSLDNGFSGTPYSSTCAVASASSASVTSRAASSVPSAIDMMDGIGASGLRRMPSERCAMGPVHAWHATSVSPCRIVHDTSLVRPPPL